VKTHQTSKQEIDKFRALITRDLGTDAYRRFFVAAGFVIPLQDGG